MRRSLFVGSKDDWLNLPVYLLEKMVCLGSGLNGGDNVLRDRASLRQFLRQPDVLNET